MEIKCPNCDNDDLNQIVWQEYIPVERALLGVEDGRLLVAEDEQKANGWWEGGMNEGLFCKQCCNEFGVPDGITIDYEGGKLLEHGLPAQCKWAAELAIEEYSEKAGLDHKGYSEDQIARDLWGDLRERTKRPAVDAAIERFKKSLPPDISIMDSQLGISLMQALERLFSEWNKEKDQ